MKCYRATALLAACLTASVAEAADYKPVKCDRPKAYSGREIRPGVTLPDAAALASNPLTAEQRSRLDAAGTRLAGLLAPGSYTAAVGDGQTVHWTGGDGATPHFWASAGKTLTAVVVLQLTEEGKLSLDDAIEKYVGGVPNGRAVRLRHLLDHRSGLFSANEDLKVRAARRYYSLDEQLPVLRKHGAMFCAGEHWRYSNSGYALLGAVIEKVDGRSLDEAIRSRIVDRLGLSTMRVLRPGTATAGVAPLLSKDEAPIDPSWAGAAGPVAASARDMLLFWQALLGGRLVSPATLKAMFDPLYPMFDPGTWYGLGVMALDVPQPDGSKLLWLGHAGGTPGASAMIAWIPARRRVVAVAVTGDKPAAAAVNLLAEAAAGEP